MVLVPPRMTTPTNPHAGRLSHHELVAYGVAIELLRAVKAATIRGAKVGGRVGGRVGILVPGGTETPIPCHDAAVLRNGFSLHASVTVTASDAPERKRRCRFLFALPPLLKQTKPPREASDRQLEEAEACPPDVKLELWPQSWTGRAPTSGRRLCLVRWTRV